MTADPWHQPLVRASPRRCWQVSSETLGRVGRSHRRYPGTTPAFSQRQRTDIGCRLYAGCRWVVDGVCHSDRPRISALSPALLWVQSKPSPGRRTARPSCCIIRRQRHGALPMDGGHGRRSTFGRQRPAYRAALTGLPATAWTLEIEIVSGSSTLFGPDVRRSTSGVRSTKLGATGSRAEQWATVNAAAWQTGLAALAPNLVVIMHGTNDQGSSRTPSAYRTDIDTIITSCALAVPAADILPRGAVRESRREQCRDGRLRRSATGAGRAALVCVS